MNVRIKPYLEMRGNERDWERIWMVTRPRNNHTIHQNLLKKIFFFQAKNLHENLRLREKFWFLANQIVSFLVSLHLSCLAVRKFYFFLRIPDGYDVLAMNIINNKPAVKRSKFVVKDKEIFR